MLQSFVTRLALALGYFGLLLLGGSLGYHLIEGWPYRDALYMTAITISAVGYEEVFPLSEAGRRLTMMLILFGITGIGIYLGILTSLLVELDLRNTLKRKKLMSRIGRLEGHIIVCGAGRTGRRVITELLDSKQSFVVIEMDPDHITRLLDEHPDLLYIEGDATQDQTLEAAGIAEAASLVATLSSDSDNVYVCLSARSLNPDLEIVARAYDDESIDKLYRAGADHVESPNVTGAVRMSSTLLRPGVMTFLDVATRSRDVALRLESATVGASSALDGVPLRNARIREETGLMVIALRKKDNGGFTFNPVADTLLERDDEMIVLGDADQIARLQKYAGHKD